MVLHFLVDGPDDLAGDDVVLTGAEAHHAAAVRRVRVGEGVTVGDGSGSWHSGECVEVTPKRVVIRITERTSVPAAAPRLVLAQALAKGDRDERAVQAATELGVDEIIPWQAARSVSRWEGMKATKGAERWRTIVREAAKQAHRAWIPDVTAPMTTAELAQRGASVLVLVLEPSATDRLTALDLSGADEILLIVGPEGGIAAEERELFAASGARIVRLGDTVLRTSTAGPAALSALAVALGRW